MNESPHVIESVDRPYARYTVDGDVAHVLVAIVPSGLPRMTSVLPAPMMDERERTRIIADARRSAIFDGLFIVSEKRIRNPAFDRRGEKTTTRFVTRPCRNTSESVAVLAQIKAELSAMGIGAVLPTATGSQP